MIAVKEEEQEQMSATFSEDSWYRIPSLQGVGSSYEIYICRKLLKSPCVCCGQEDHSEARIVKDETTGEEHGEYICEVSRVHGKSFSEAVAKEGIYRHVPCPQKFALKNGFQLSEIALAWDIFMEKGYGHHIPYRLLRVLWEEIKTICEEERISWTFTRDDRWRPPHISINEEDTNDVMLTEDESDESGETNNDGSNKRQRTGK